MKLRALSIALFVSVSTLPMEASADGHFSSSPFVFPFEVSCINFSQSSRRIDHDKSGLLHVTQLRQGTAIHANWQIPDWLTDKIGSDLKELCNQPNPNQEQSYLVYNVIDTPIGRVSILERDYVVPTTKLFISHQPTGYRTLHHCDVILKYNEDERFCVYIP